MKLSNNSVIRLGKILKNSREEHNFSLEQVRIRLENLGIKVNRSDIQRVENAERKVPNAILIKNLCKVYNLDVIKLFKEIDYLDDDVLKSNLSIDAEELRHPAPKGKIQVPVYDSVSAGAGLEPNPEPVDYMYLSEDEAQDCVIINVHGDSMEPTIQNGASIMLKKGAEVYNNEIGVFIVNNEAVVKRHKIFNAGHYLFSDNTAYPTREIRDEDDVKVCGKVIWIMNRP